MVLVSCQTLKLNKAQANPKVTEKELAEAPKAVWVNPHTPGTYKHFKAEKSYPKTWKTYKNASLLARTNSSNSWVKINLKLQRAFLMNGNQVAMDYPISSGRKKYPTPTGSFRIMEKIKDKRSNLYGKVLNANGGVVKSNADSRKDSIPAGGSFRGASMPNWMRLTGDGVGMHTGRVPRYPASHGCIRTPKAITPIVFSKVRTGTKVIISSGRAPKPTSSSSS